MRSKNNGIYLFILEEIRRENRERALKEKIQREQFLKGSRRKYSKPSYKYSVSPDTFKRKEQSRKFAIGRQAAVFGGSLISIIALLEIDAILQQNLYSYSLQYWVVTRIALIILWIAMIAPVLLKLRALGCKK